MTWLRERLFLHRHMKACRKLKGDALRARAGRPTARATLRCLGYSATIAIAGCGSNTGSPAGNDVERSLGPQSYLNVWTAPDTGCKYYIYREGYGNYAVGSLSIRFRADGSADCPRTASGTFTEGGDVKQAPSDSLSGPASRSEETPNAR